VLPGGRFFQVNPCIDSQPGIPLRIFLELLFAPVTAEIIFLVFEGTGEFRILFINYHETDRIGCHGVYLVPVQESWLFPYELSPLFHGMIPGLEVLDRGIRVLLLVMLDEVGGDIGIRLDEEEEHQHRQGRRDPEDLQC
jgi:hypothetical protein